MSLILSGRCVGLRTETFPRKDGSKGVSHELSVADEDGVLTCKVPDMLLMSLTAAELSGLRTFGTDILVKCRPRLGNDFGRAVAGLEADQLQITVESTGPVGLVDPDTGELVNA